jgi:hypothetical protein
MQNLNVLAVLRTELMDSTGVNVSTAVPSPHPESFIVLNRFGGAKENGLIDAPYIDMDIYATTELRAYELAEKVRDCMGNLDFAKGFARVTETEFKQDNDMELKLPRWYAQYQLKTYKPIS